MAAEKNTAKRIASIINGGTKHIKAKILPIITMTCGTRIENMHLAILKYVTESTNLRVPFYSLLQLAIINNYTGLYIYYENYATYLLK